MAINDLLFRPAWFLRTELLFGIIAFLITLIISYYSYRVYKIYENKKYKYLTVSFFSMSLGFMFKAISDLIIVYFDAFLKTFRFFGFISPTYIYTGSLILYVFFVLSGFVILSCLASQVRNKSIILSLLSIAFLCAILVRQARSFTFFYFFAFVLLVVYIVPYMYNNYKDKKNKSSYFVFLSFALLAVSNLLFIALSSRYSAIIYTGGHFISLLAYILLLLNLTLVLKK